MAKADRQARRQARKDKKSGSKEITQPPENIVKLAQQGSTPIEGSEATKEFIERNFPTSRSSGGGGGSGGGSGGTSQPSPTTPPTSSRVDQAVSQTSQRTQTQLRDTGTTTSQQNTRQQQAQKDLDTYAWKKRRQLERDIKKGMDVGEANLILSELTKGKQKELEEGLVEVTEVTADFETPPIKQVTMDGSIAGGKKTVEQTDPLNTQNQFFDPLEGIEKREEPKIVTKIKDIPFYNKTIGEAFAKEGFQKESGVLKDIKEKVIPKVGEVIGGVSTLGAVDLITSKEETQKEFKKGQEVGKFAGEVVGEFIPSTAGQLVITAGLTAGAIASAPVVSAGISGLIGFTGVKGALDPTLTPQQRVASGIAGGLGVAGLGAETIPLIKGGFARLSPEFRPIKTEISTFKGQEFETKFIKGVKVEEGIITDIGIIPEGGGVTSGKGFQAGEGALVRGGFGFKASEQVAGFGGQELRLTTSQRGLEIKTGKVVESDPTISDLGFFFTPADPITGIPQTRVSRLGLQNPFKAPDLKTTEFGLISEGKPQIIVTEPTKIVTKGTTGKGGEARVSPKGSSELEVTSLSNIEITGRGGKTIIKGQEVPIFKGKLTDKPVTTMSGKNIGDVVPSTRPVTTKISTSRAILKRILYRTTKTTGKTGVTTPRITTKTTTTSTISSPTSFIRSTTPFKSTRTTKEITRGFLSKLSLTQKRLLSERLTPPTKPTRSNKNKGIVKVPSRRGRAVRKALKKISDSGQSVDIITGLTGKKKGIVRERRLPPKLALKKAQEYVDENIEASFRLRVNKAKPKRKDIKRVHVSRKFVGAKTNPLFRKELSKFRLDSKSEKAQIKRARKGGKIKW